MDPGGEVTRVELGGAGRRRWWPLVVGALVAWVITAAALSRGDGEANSGAAAPTPTETPTTRAPTTTERPPRTSTTALGAPFLGGGTGWQLLAVGGSGSVRVLDLDTGQTSRLDADGLLAARPDGAVLQTRSGAVWAPVPFAEETWIPLQGGGGWAAALPRDSDVVWFGTPEQDGVVLVSLLDGSVVRTVDLPTSHVISGVVGDSLVIGAGGGTYVVDVDGTSRRLTDGTPLGVVDVRVAVQRCEDVLRCGVVLVALGGDELSVEWPDGRFATNPSRASGPLGLLQTNDGHGHVVDASGTVVGLPYDTSTPWAWASAWSPDGSLLFAPSRVGAEVLDPITGATVATIPWDSATRSQLAVVGPAG